jgi:uncharacterized protein with HEPN domain
MRPENPRRILKTLDDIRDAASFILTATTGKDQDDYRRDRPLKQAVERNFEITGEAIGRLFREAPELAQRTSKYERASTNASSPFETS